MSFTAILKTVKDAKRLEEVLAALVDYKYGHLLKSANITHFLPWRHRLKTEHFADKPYEPEQLANLFEHLGGAFLKLAQLLSLRPDLIPHEYCQALGRLQDHVRPVPFADIDLILQNQLKEKYADIVRIDSKPLASASIAQVHTAQLTNGKTIVFKVQRPDIWQIFETDIDLLEKFAEVLEKLYPKLPFEPKRIVEEFKVYTKGEFDFLREAKNIDRFYKAYFTSPDVTIPRIFWEYSGKKIIAMEHVHGKPFVKLKEEKPEYREEILRKFLHTILDQIIVQGFFHADPHPGNLYYRNHKVVLLDYGIIGFLTEEARYAMGKLFMAVMNKDTKTFTRAVLKLGIAQGQVNREGLEADIAQSFLKYYDSDVGGIQFTDLFRETFALVRKYKLHVPTHFVLLGKTLMTTESVLQTIDPGFNIIKESRLYASKHKKTAMKKMWKGTLSSINKFKDFFTSLPEKSEDISYKLETFNRNVGAIHSDLSRLNRTLDKSAKIISLTLFFFAFLAVGYFSTGPYRWLFYTLAIFTMFFLLWDFLKS